MTFILKLIKYILKGWWAEKKEKYDRQQTGPGSVGSVSPGSSTNVGCERPDSTMPWATGWAKGPLTEGEGGEDSEQDDSVQFVEGVVGEDKVVVKLVGQFKLKGISDNFGRITVETWEVHEEKEFNEIATRLMKLLAKELRKE
jgi:hypothetical protein